MSTCNSLQIPPIGSFISGQELDDLLLAGIKDKEETLTTHLSRFDGKDLFPKWLELMRCMDELINLRYTFRPGEWEALGKSSADIMHDTGEFFLFLNEIRKRFGVAVMGRIQTIVFMLSCMKMVYSNKGLPGMDFRNINEVVAFVQARRLYYLTYLTFIRLYAKGIERVPFKELLCNFQYQIDFNMCSITSALHAIIANKSIDGYGVTVCDYGLEYSMPYNQLDEFFLEPQVMNELDIIEFEEYNGYKNASAGVSRQLYSHAELEHAVKQVEYLYEGYGIKDSLELAEAKRMVVDLRGRFVEEYSIKMPEGEFVSFNARYPHLKLASEANDYFEAINERPAFFKFDGFYYSNVFLVIRYIENAIYGLLRRNRRFRIKAGFVFEKKVKELLKQYGFESTETKRIYSQEFDVICMKNGCAYNFQCKNNYIDINMLSTANVDKVSRKNKRLIRYYEKALEKENFRTKLVQDHFKVEHVENYVVARFPIVMNHDRLIPFNRLENWLKEEQY